MSLASTLAVALLAGLPEVLIVDEHRPGGDPTEIKITLINRTEGRILISFAPDWYMDYFTFRLFDERGRPVKLKYTEGLQDINSLQRVQWPKPGESATGYLSPTIDYVIPPGRYQVAVVYRYWVQSRQDYQEVESNRITKIFP